MPKSLTVTLLQENDACNMSMIIKEITPDRNIKKMLIKNSIGTCFKIDSVAMEYSYLERSR